MKNHPLFNANETTAARQNIDISYINITQFETGRRITLTNQWAPEELLTWEQLYEAVGSQPGHFELTGRDARGKVVDREQVRLKTPGQQFAEARPPTNGQQQAPNLQPQPQAVPDMPPNVDPMTALIWMLRQDAAQQREDARLRQTETSQMMLGIVKANVDLTTGLITGLSGFVRPPQPDGSQVAVEAFLKGADALSGLMAGVRDASGQAGQPGVPIEPKGPPLDWQQVSKNILESLKQVADIARATAGKEPIIPPGGPTE